MFSVIYSKLELFLKNKNENLKCLLFFSKFEFEFTFNKIKFLTVTYKTEN